MDTKMNDFLGQAVEVGDRVVISVTGYRDFQLGKIAKITPKGVQVETGGKDWRGQPEVTHRLRHMFVKVAQ